MLPKPLGRTRDTGGKIIVSIKGERNNKHTLMQEGTRKGQDKDGKMTKVEKSEKR